MMNPLLVKIEALQIQLTIEQKKFSSQWLQQWQNQKFALQAKTSEWLNYFLEQKVLTTPANTSSSATQPIQKKLYQLQNQLTNFQDNTVSNLKQSLSIQKERLQTLIEEIISFLDDLMLPIYEQNPYFWEDLKMNIAQMKESLERFAYQIQQNSFLELNIKSESLNQQLIAIRHRMEEQKTELIQVPSKTYDTISRTISVIEDDIKRLFM